MGYQACQFPIYIYIISGRYITRFWLPQPQHSTAVNPTENQTKLLRKIGHVTHLQVK
jgi:hypothetical protein